MVQALCVMGASYGLSCSLVLVPQEQEDSDKVEPDGHRSKGHRRDEAKPFLLFRAPAVAAFVARAHLCVLSGVEAHENRHDGEDDQDQARAMVIPLVQIPDDPKKDASLAVASDSEVHQLRRLVLTAQPLIVVPNATSKKIGSATAQDEMDAGWPREMSWDGIGGMFF